MVEWAHELKLSYKLPNLLHVENKASILLKNKQPASELYTLFNREKWFSLTADLTSSNIN